MSKVTVNIFGQKYTVAGEESEDRILKIASIVDSKMKDIEESADRSLPLTYLSVLSAINITNDYLASEDDKDDLKAEIEQMEDNVKHYEELWNQAKSELENIKEKNKFFEKEIDDLTINLKNRESEINELTSGRRSMREEIRKGVENQLQEAEAKYKDLENNFFDLQMENIKMKSEIEKLRGEKE